MAFSFSLTPVIAEETDEDIVNSTVSATDEEIYDDTADGTSN